MIFDAHGDILTDVYEMNVKGVDIWETYHKNLYQKGQITGSIFINFIDPNSEDKLETFSQINKISVPYFKNHPDINIIGENSFSTTKFNVLLGIEGLSALKSVADIDQMYELGYRNFGLTWNEPVNNFAHSNVMEKKGLTAEGEKLIAYANDKNILIDLAHASKQTFMDVAKLTTNPLFVSHSGMRSIVNIPRNIDDEQLQLIKKTNGVVGIYVIKDFITYKSVGTVSDVVDHIEHVIKTIGIDHVCLGLDFCHYLITGHDSENDVAGLEDISRVGNLVEELENRGYTSAEIDKITYKNIKRVIFDTLKI